MPTPEGSTTWQNEINIGEGTKLTGNLTDGAAALPLLVCSSSCVMHGTRHIPCRC
jgi:hypothetical protein